MKPIDEFFAEVAPLLEAIAKVNRQHTALYREITATAKKFDMSRARLEEDNPENYWNDIDRLDEVASLLGEDRAFNTEWGSLSDQPEWWTASTC